MKALLSRVVGGPETLTIEDLPDPIPGPGQVCLRVRACGVNYPDALFIRDLYQVKWPRPFSPGGEVCGVVESLGEGVSGLSVGDLVVSRCGIGGMAQRLVQPARNCIRIPSDTQVEVAAGFLLTYATAYHGLVDRGGIGPGETLLVLGAAGGVGVAAIDVGRALGARVVAAVSSEEKAAFARGMGAQDSYVYPSAIEGTDAAKAVSAGFKTLVGDRGADVVFDPVGGAYSEAALRAIARGGRFLVVGFAAGIPRVPLNLTLLKACQIIGVDLRMFGEEDPERNAANARLLLGMLAEGRLKPAVSEVFPLERAHEALERLPARRALGKMVVRID
jgi:NADPH2:quinone reductase